MYIEDKNTRTSHEYQTLKLKYLGLIYCDSIGLKVMKHSAEEVDEKNEQYTHKNIIDI